MIFSKYITAEPFGKQGSSTFAPQMPAAGGCLPFLAVRVKHICSANASCRRLSASLGSAGQAHLLRKCQPQAAVCLSWQCGSSTFALQMPAASGCLPFLAVRVKHICFANASFERLTRLRKCYFSMLSANRMRIYPNKQGVSRQMPMELPMFFVFSRKTDEGNRTFA